jgi:pyruvate dehydrogenase E1 component beta subunit
VILLEHKLLSSLWRESVGGSRESRETLDVPSAETLDVQHVAPIPFGRAARVVEGADVVLVSVAMGVHRSVEASRLLAQEGLSATVLDLRTTAPLDRELLLEEASRASVVVVVDEDHGPFGLSAEVGAVLAENRVAVPFARVTATGAIPYARRLERAVLPSTGRVVEAVRYLLTEPA